MTTRRQATTMPMRQLRQRRRLCIAAVHVLDRPNRFELRWWPTKMTATCSTSAPVAQTSRPRTTILVPTKTTAGCEDYPGCTDDSACNFDPQANEDNGTCQQLDPCGECGGSGAVYRMHRRVCGQLRCQCLRQRRQLHLPAAPTQSHRTSMLAPTKMTAAAFTPVAQTSRPRTTILVPTKTTSSRACIYPCRLHRRQCLQF